jgi:hypothetical protein
MELFSELGILSVNRGELILSDITKVVKLYPILIKTFQKPIYFFYSNTDFKRPEDVAHDWHGSSEYWWLVLMINGIMNPFEDWVKTGEELEKHCMRKYGSFEAFQDPHHYFDEKSGISYTNPHPGAKPITNWSWEYEQNEKKKIIKVVHNRFLPAINKEIQLALQ